MTELSSFQLYSIDLDAAEIEHKTKHQLAGLHAEALKGNQKAWHDLWLYGTKLVLKICNKLSSMDLLRCEYEEAVAEGNAAIGEALTRWNPKKSSFGTWVWIRVRGAILDESKKWSPEPGVVPAEVTLSDDQEHGDDEYTNSLYDLADEEYLGEDPALDLDKARLRRVLPALPERELKYVTLYYFEDQTLNEIADLEGISRNMVHKILKRAEARLGELLLGGLTISAFER